MFVIAEAAYTESMRPARHTLVSNLLATGIWHSIYRYTSDSRRGLFENEHFVRMVSEGDEYVAESLPNDSKSSLSLRLSVEDGVATGTWREHTSPIGYYKGAIYHGAIQLIVSENGQSLQGKWVGFGKSQTINVGAWELSYVGRGLPTDQHLA